jgi:hypothetical protein
LTERGYARHLLKLLHYVLADPANLPPFPEAWGSPPPPLPTEHRQSIPYGIGAFLYSDVGHFYEKCTIGETRPGYIIDGRENAELVWKILPSSPGNGSHSQSQSGSTKDKDKVVDFEWEYMSEKDVVAALPELSRAARKAIQDTDATGQPVITMGPANPGTVFYVPVRILWEKAQATDTHIRETRPMGIRVVNTSEKSTIVLFAPKNKMINPRTLITMMHNVRPDHLPSLLGKLDEFAKEDGGEGWVWGLQPEDELVKAWQGLKEREVKVSQREGVMNHLLGVVYYGPEGERPDFKSSDMWNWC